MDEKLYELGFDKNMVEFIKATENVFNKIAKQECSTATMIEWVERNMNEALETGVLSELSERERFLFVLGILNGLISEKYGS